MAKGRVKWFDNRRGLGFIVQETGLDVFVHHTDINEKGFKTLHEGDIVSYNLIFTEKGPKAQGVQRVKGEK
ncbi:MAG: cold shock domain-containing protein [Verrucomicrobiota bacterium]